MWALVKRAWEWAGSDPEALAQLAHIGWGCALTLIVHVHYSMLVSVLTIAILSVLKEISEYWTETGETRGWTMLDIAFWWVGIVLAAVFG